MVKRDINGVPYTYENKDELAFGTEFEESWDDAMQHAHDVMETEQFANDMKEQNLIETLEHVGMRVFDGDDIQYMLDNGITPDMVGLGKPKNKS